MGTSTVPSALLAWDRRRVEKFAENIQEHHGDRFVAAGLRLNCLIS